MDRVWKVMDEPAPPPRRWGEPWLAYGVAGALLAAAAAAAAAVGGAQTHLLYFGPAVAGAAILGGGAPALAATAAGIAAVLLLRGAAAPLTPLSVDLFVFGGLGLLAGYLGARLQAIRRRQEEMQRHVEERQSYLQSILDTVPDAMVVIDERGVIQSFSRAAERAFGFDAGEVLGRSVNLLMPAPDREAHDGYLETYARTAERHIIGIGRIVTARRKDGANFPVELAVGEARSGARRVFTGFIRDLTLQEEAKARLGDLQTELAHLSRLSAMGEMAAALAHELNQPLSAIANYINAARVVLGPAPADPRLADTMARAAEQALRAGEIVRRLREFIARGESQRDVESLREVVDEAAALALTGAKERGVRVRFERDPEVDLVLIDKVQVQQVLVNLIRNALEAMEESARRELLIGVDAASGEMARITIADTGAGIAPDLRDQLFQPFFTTKGAQGMGVGLSICRTIVEALGGEIWFAPSPAGGAAFMFTLPRVREEEMA